MIWLCTHILADGGPPTVTLTYQARPRGPPCDRVASPSSPACSHPVHRAYRCRLPKLPVDVDVELLSPVNDACIAVAGALQCHGGTRLDGTAVGEVGGG